MKISCEEPLETNDYNNNKSHCDIIKDFESVYYIKADEKSIDIEIKGVEPGKTTLIINTNNNKTEYSQSSNRY